MRLDQELIDYLLALSDQVQTEVKSSLRDLELTDTQVGVLWRLSSEQEMTARQLADRLHCDASTASSMIDRLERQGVVHRIPHPTDRRAKLLQLTPRGCELRDSVVRLAVERSPFACLGRDDRALLHDLLRQAAGPDVPRRESVKSRSERTR